MRLLAKKSNSFFISFALNTNYLFFQIKISDANSNQFGATNSSSIQELKNCFIANRVLRRKCFIRYFIKYMKNFINAQINRKFFGDTRSLELKIDHNATCF